ncbi:Hypothetical protein PHPALM_19611 [Phytophthora palmivora]|uniref:RxLR effector protein n=1 Tax=Phytophthora palmivora TaxID=4796 RepID=A0A2P4XGY8_9STRA|nr:Hypothetical protein PHPALM_19611 [Phytophthora palmivora]
MCMNFVVLAAMITFIAWCNAVSAAQPVNPFAIDNDDANDDDDIDSSDDEERGGKTWAERFANWHRNGVRLEPVVRQAYKYGRIKDLDNSVYCRKWAAYSAYLKGKESQLSIIC